MLGRTCAVLTLCVGTGALACHEDDAGIPDCVEVDTSCAALYEPTFDNVFSMTLSVSCGIGGGSCHANADAGGAAGGLVMSDVDATYDLLVDAAREPRAFVEPGDASCSLLGVRLFTDDEDIRMPPGSNPLDAGARCAIAQWIENGAMR